MDGTESTDVLMETVEQLVSFQLMHVQLNGGAPWGFTLKGGLEHGEPLIISKIEEGGKAAKCKKLRVGDELVNINGSALYGSRQEALILIKGSYRVLKIVIRRRSVPLIRPHSWHLAKLSEAPCTTGTADASDGPPAMQLHFTPFSVPWNSGGDNSELSMQWGHISRHYSIDRSSSIGSMESLEYPPNQSYYDSQLSPIDPVIFNNKRDSAYSSFSASSNTSDYTVSMKPEETNSTDNLLQGLGSSCRYPEGGQHSVPSGHGGLQEESESFKSKLLSHIPKAKVHPSSYSCEEEQCVPPQPPMRKDSFRATRGQPVITDKRCVSAPVGIPSLTNCIVEDQPPIQEVLTGNFYLNGMQDNEQELKGNNMEPYYTLNLQRESSREIKAREGENKQLENHSKSVERSPPPLSSFLEKNRDEHFGTQQQPECNLQSAMHRHSAPEKLLASKLHMMDFSSDKSDLSASPTCQRSQSPLYMREASPEMVQGKWGASRCSTPSSLSTSELEGSGLEEEKLVSGQNLWGQSVNELGNPLGIPEHESITNSQTLEQNFGPVSANNCLDSNISENAGEINVDDVTKQSHKRQFRSSKSRRRSERFATNLRNEIQRKKAQLQKSKCPSGLPCGEETVEEEQVGDLNMEPVSPPDNHQHRAQIPTSPLTNPPTASKKAPQVPAHDITQAEEHSRTRMMGCQTSQTQPQISQPTQHNRPVCVHVVEETLSAGKPCRWCWTPEHKLKLETEPTESKKNESTGPIWLGQMGTMRGRTSSSGGRLGRSDECDIPPFADRRRFFEETSRKLSQSVTNLSNLTSRNQRPDKQIRQNKPSSLEPLESATNLGRRRFSYQGVVQDGLYVNSLDTMGHFMSTQHDQEKVRERLIEREQEKEHEREMEQERIKELERLQEQERQKEWEKEQEREQERLKEEKQKEQQRVKDWEERQRLLKREKQWDSVRETILSEHNISSNTVPHSLSHDAYLKQPPSHQVPSSLQSSEHYCSNTAINVQKPCSAFHAVTGQHNQYDGYHVIPPYNARSYTPTEANPAQEREQTKINRKFSLAERDYSRSRRDSRKGEGAGVPGFGAQYSNSSAGGSTEEYPGLRDFSPLRNCAMSENDIHVETQDHHNHISNSNMSRMRASTLSELDKNGLCVGEVKKKKGPPRPPPPKWEQFHKRRASHHNLFSSPPIFSLPSSSPPRPQQCMSHPLSVPEMTRQRSYSLPPKEVPESHHCCCQDYSAASPSPAFMCRAFKPVALAPRERDIAPQNYGTRREFDQPLPRPEPCMRVPVHNATVSEYEPKATTVKAIFHEHRVEWDKSSTHHSVVQSTSKSADVPENRSLAGLVCPESYFSMNYYHLQPQQAGFPGTSHKNLIISSHNPGSSEDGNMPLETDIDEICENERAGEVEAREAEDRMEMQGFARPIMVLETDIDNMPEEEAPSARVIRGQRGSLVDFILDEDYGITRKELMGELFPQCAETEMAGESWRGGYPISGDNLERPSKQAASTAQVSWSTCYDTSTDDSQLLAKIREISERKVEEEELNYKTQLIESLHKKLGVLREAQRSLQEDIRSNAQLGEEVESLVLAICKPNEVDKYRMFIGDLEKVTSLLLSLSGRLIRVESALDCVDPETGHRERLQLLEKKKQLLMQMGEAQELKEHVDRREQAVGMVLSRCLTPEQMRDYGHFVKMKAALLVEQRQLDDKIRLGEEQHRGLRESLGLGLGVGLGFGHY
ncbi:protein Shroom4-like isoform X1 [Xyrauchen texanus]|uniref:protein Shroom4-like isoform X1 n=2 Tax=Xyrauchen texanus TaxID=154827 RepID=UPI002241F55E|nr:protein Shroom4-like isoform X1 [Xyrauchen texanus]